MNLLLQAANTRPRGGVTRIFRNFGAFGLFVLAILDSSPVPTFGGPDILIAILAGTHRNPWYECVPVAAAGSVIGAYLTYRIARRLGLAYLHGKFGNRVNAAMSLYQQRGAGILVASTAVPFPFPTSLIFAAAGASGYPLVRFIGLVSLCRTIRYLSVALIADYYGRPFVRVLRHPTQYWGWLILFAAIVAALAGGGIWMNRRLGTAPSTAANLSS